MMQPDDCVQHESDSVRQLNDFSSNKGHRVDLTAHHDPPGHRALQDAL